MSAYQQNVSNNNNVRNVLLTEYERYMRVQIKLSPDVPNYNELKEKYIQNAITHNNNLFNNKFPDAGFNLLVPEQYECYPYSVNKIDFGVICEARIISKTHNNPSGFYMYPRSSTGSKTLLRLSNSVGIIDSGYRGNLIGCFDVVEFHQGNTQKLEPFQSIVQICAPSLIPIYVEIVDELYENTERGNGGFGSTGY
jgi:dUTP pyrophosphatase